MIKKPMKNLIYILIFLPSLLFSQETKNMEFVEILNLKFENPTPNSGNDEHEFIVGSNLVYKIVSLTSSNISSNYYLNGEILHIGSGDYTYKPFPLWIKTGTHQVTVGGGGQNPNSLTLYVQVYKLTTP